MRVIKNKVQPDYRHVHCTLCDKKLYSGVPIYKLIFDAEEDTCAVDWMCEECLKELHNKIGEKLK